MAIVGSKVGSGCVVGVFVVVVAAAIDGEGVVGAAGAVGMSGTSIA